MIRLKRLSEKPVLLPNPEHEWEKCAVFNCAVLYENGYFHLFYRASNNAFKLDTPKPEEKYKFVSSIGYAKSADGIHFERFDEPVLVGSTEQEAWGIEDPRITKLEGKYYMLYTAFGGRSWEDIRITLVESEDLRNWSGKRILLDEPNKDAALLAERVKGKYVLFHRRHPDVWIAYSDDLKTWYDHRIIMTPRPGFWDSKKIGIAGPPLKLDEGWLLIYHGVDENHVYRLGAALLDLEDPSKVLARQEEPILEPELEWEKHGLVPNVVFSCGACEKDGVIYVYYGAADTCIGVAAVEKGNIRF
ncbi:1,4-beta-mannosyl-N-acetylglucosamine phosphorylase [Fervidicola ferrireducens]|uniref:1,4-beta-mannosyl-N-acetylglucosamine phosphorylase n=1 Tax=Fervidicola ferrireducens TaxID=520764 RepID=A0A140L124_9FIRM|nr:glycosidase [Fervidicola ferrireducens]KXG74249.1 1,4-beta-mannosyl-N-acetylglucosamine phosphorylase [Fervidicola ferrireducens]